MAPFDHGLQVTKRHHLVTSLSPSTCQRRLSQKMAPRFPWSPGEHQPVRGWVSERRFTLTKRIDHQNWFQTQALGEFTAIPEGTRITVRLRPSLLAMLWFGGCFAWVLFIGSVCIIAAIALPPSSPAGPIWYAGAALAMLLFLLFYIWLGRWLARDESAFLLEFLSETLKAEKLLQEAECPQTGDARI